MDTNGKCPTCGGQGFIVVSPKDTRECHSCHGSGERRDTITKHIPVPPLGPIK